MRDVLRGLDLGQLQWPLFFHGPPGTGKTCAVLCVLDRLRPHRTEYQTMGALCEWLIRVNQGREFHGGGGVPWNSSDWWRRWSGALVTVLDEIGTRNNVSDAHFATLQQAIDTREELPAIYVSNEDLGTLARLYDDRIASRLGSGTVLCAQGMDRRLTRAD